MKKILALFAMMVWGSAISYAQVAAPSAPQKRSSRAKKTLEGIAQTPITKEKSSRKTKAAKSELKNATGIRLKKDGTPDKRYKTVKNTVEVRLKKDGTPDKRYRVKDKIEDLKEEASTQAGETATPEKKKGLLEGIFGKSGEKKPAPAVAPGAKEANGLNKDGTPDMRLKENRREGYNKDGSLDMRYKANREAAK